MYTKDSLIKDIVHAINETNENIETLSRQMSLRNGELSKVLKFIGFEYKKHKWIFNGEDRSLLDLPFKELQLKISNRGNTDNTSSNNSNKGNSGNTNNTKSNKRNKRNKDNTSNTDSLFTLEEIQALKQLAQLHIEKQFIADTSKHSDIDILKRIQALQANGTDRKTFVIDRDLIQQFDVFCDSHRVKKSDVISIALVDLLEKYKWLWETVFRETLKILIMYGKYK